MLPSPIIRHSGSYFLMESGKCYEDKSTREEPFASHAVDCKAMFKHEALIQRCKEAQLKGRVNQLSEQDRETCDKMGVFKPPVAL